MHRLKKIFYFLAGLILFPVFVGLILFWGLGYDNDYRYVDFWGGAYFLVYLIFPLLYRGKVKEKIKNRYIFYALLYVPFILLFIVLYS